MTKTSPTNIIATTVAIGLAGFSGAVATYGLTKFAPGAELTIAAMGVLFEAGKLTSFAMLHKRMPRSLKGALLVVGLVLMTLNVVGVSGFLSAAYERQQLAAKATSHTAESTAHASASLVERQLAQAESTLAAARQAQIRARDDKARARAAKQIVDQATAERDALVAKLAAAQTTTAKVEGDSITAGAEFAAIGFVSAATGLSTDTIAHLVIFIVAALPDALAILLLVAATSNSPAPTPSTRKTIKRRRTIRRPNLKVIPNAASANA